MTPFTPGHVYRIQSCELKSPSLRFPSRGMQTQTAHKMSNESFARLVGVSNGATGCLGHSQHQQYSQDRHYSIQNAGSVGKQAHVL